MKWRQWYTMLQLHVGQLIWSKTPLCACMTMSYTQVRGSQCNCYLASTCICCRDVSSMRCWFHSHRPVWRQLPVSLVCAWCGSSASLQWECPPPALPQRLRSPVSERKSAMKIHGTWSRYGPVIVCSLPVYTSSRACCRHNTKQQIESIAIWSVYLCPSPRIINVKSQRRDECCQVITTQSAGDDS